jgi:hypothetical protein
MKRHRLLLLSAVMTCALAAPVAGQGGGMMGMGRMGGRDSATAAQMAVVHELVVNHAKITRTVTNLPDGIRTVTESDDPRVAQLIREHVVTMGQRVARGDDPGLPMETPALHAIFQNRERIRTTTEVTARGIIVVETSTDPAAVAVLQKHAAEITDLVTRGMAAMHETMMQNRGAMHGGASTPTPATDHAMHDHAAHTAAAADSSFAALQQRGLVAMGVDQYTSVHHFDELPDGGRIELHRTVDDSAGVKQIRAHLREIARAFAAGDFSTPAFVHMKDVPGAQIMAAKRAVISYTFSETPWGGEVRMITRDAEARAAIHEFLKFQREDHRTDSSPKRLP